MSIAFLFPGQGSQVPGMLHRLPDHLAVKNMIEEASNVLDLNVFHLDTAEALRSTVAVQLALLISGVAMASALMKEGGKPSYVAGHSVGAFGAAVVSGAMSFCDALLIVKLRAQLMEQSFPSGYCMGVIVGLDLWQVQKLIDQADTNGENVFIATINAEEQITIAGTILGVRLVLEAAHRQGVRKAELLRVAVPSHCQLLEPIEIKLREAMRLISLQKPLTPYIANTIPRLMVTPEIIREDLVRSIANPVRWHDMTTLLHERGVCLFIEMPPGNVFSSLAMKSFPAVRSIASEEMGIDSLLYFIHRDKDVHHVIAGTENL